MSSGGEGVERCRCFLLRLTEVWPRRSASQASGDTAS
jgi:hypothetical protein